MLARLARNPKYPPIHAYPTQPPTRPAPGSMSSDESDSDPICTVCKKTKGAPLCHFYPASVYGADALGSDDHTYIHLQCGKTAGMILSMAQVKKTYGQGKAAKLALTRTRTAYGPRTGFGSNVELVLLKEYEANLKAGGGGKVADKKKTSGKKATKTAASKKKPAAKKKKTPSHVEIHFAMLKAKMLAKKKSAT